MILVLVDELNERMHYTFDFIFKERNVSYTLITSVHDFESSRPGFRLNYSNHRLDGGLHILPSSLLTETGITDHRLDKSMGYNIECLSFDGISDPIASVFYVLTAYESYTTQHRDQHDRFPYARSILKKFKWIELAVCDRWSRQLIEMVDKDLYLESALRSSLLKESSGFVPTFDIDNAYAYMHKTGNRRFFSVMRDYLQVDTKRIQERKKVESGAMKDPYDTYDEMLRIAQTFDSTLFFWLTESNKPKDRNVDIRHPEIQRRIKELRQTKGLGLHPSYESYRSESIIRNEKLKLESISESPVERSRQHYLRSKLPDTYRALLAAGIKHDYSMGFAEHIGFRVGTARPYFWFDLAANKITEMKVHPFVYMDGSLNEYMNLSVEESKQRIETLYKEVTQYGGDFVFIWHNETIGGYGKWNGWQEVLRFTLSLRK